MVLYLTLGRCILPATTILHLVKEAFISEGADASKQNIEFENVEFRSATTIKPNTSTELSVSILLSTGKFHIAEGKRVIASGMINYQKDSQPIRDVQSFYDENLDLPILSSDEFYKELQIRGYNFDGLFKSLHKARTDGCYGQIRWNGNWATFIDGLLQLYQLSIDSRSLNIPTSIGRVLINVDEHLKWLETITGDGTGEKLCDAFFLKELSTLTCGGIEICGIEMIPVAQRLQEGIETLDTYKFIPLVESSILFDLNDVANIFAQLILEKLQTNQIKVVEILSDVVSMPMIDHFYENFQKVPSLCADLTLLRDNDEISLVNVQSIQSDRISNLKNYSDCTFIVMNRWLPQSDWFETAQCALSVDGFLILIENGHKMHHDITAPPGFTFISMLLGDDVTFTLMQRTTIKQNNNQLKIIRIDSGDENFNWLPDIQETNQSDDVLLIAQNNTSGLLGLVNCLRLEPATNNVRCMIIEDSDAPPFNVNEHLYQKQLSLQLPINIYQDGKWGTYRHLSLTSTATKRESGDPLSINIAQIGNIRSINWVPDIYSNSSVEVIRIQYAALNFRDVMIASGKLSSRAIWRNRMDEYHSKVGFEYAGVTLSGRRVMGFNPQGISTVHCENIEYLLDVPDTMSLRDAATILVVYFTVYCAFFLNTSIRAGQSILIHAGSGGVGLAAIRVAFAYGLNVFTTVSTTQKKKFILKEFPQLKGIISICVDKLSLKSLYK